MSRGDAAARRLYTWEDRVVAPRDPARVPFARLQALVDHVWAAEGLRWPPQVQPLPAQSRRTLARATRTVIQAPPALPSWILLHELAHAMTTDVEGRSAGHGPDFVGVYVALLVRHARLDQAELVDSLRDAGIAWNPGAQPTVGR